MKTYKFFVEGMHCKSCVVLTESELNDLPHVEKAISDLQTCCVEVTGEFGENAPDIVADNLSKVLTRHGYRLLVEKPIKKINWKDFKLAVPIALGFMALFVLLQKLGIVNLAKADSVGLSTALIIGVVASLSTCMAVVGGLVLSISAKFAKEGKKVMPQVSFHLARLITFFALGGAIGAVGA